MNRACCLCERLKGLGPRAGGSFVVGGITVSFIFSFLLPPPIDIFVQTYLMGDEQAAFEQMCVTEHIDTRALREAEG